MIVRWGLEELGPLLDELGLERPLLVTSPRFADLEVPGAERFIGVRRHAPLDVVAAATEPPGGGRARRASGAAARSTPERRCPQRPGCRSSPSRRRTPAPSGRRTSACATRRGARRPVGSGRHTVAVVYEPALTLDLPRDGDRRDRDERARALRRGAVRRAVRGRDDSAAALIARVAPRGRRRTAETLDARTRAARGRDARGEGARRARALPRARDGPGARRTLRRVARRAATRSASPPALRFNAQVVPEAIASSPTAVAGRRRPARVEELARLGGFERLRDLGIPEDELHDVAVEVAERPAARANPRPGPPGRSRRCCARSGDPLTERHPGRRM